MEKENIYIDHFEKNGREITIKNEDLEKKKRVSLFNREAKKTFLEFWSLYPKKIGKKKCETKFIQILKKENVTGEDILAGLQRLLPEYLQRETKYIPNPETFLNQGRWDDETETTKPDWML